MELVKPGLGLIFWMTITFSIVLFLLSKFAWKPILNSIREREDSINNALNSAEEARKQMDALKSDNERLLNQARAERDLMLKKANEMKESIIAQAKKSAEEEGPKIIVKANASIESTKINAMNELKTQVAVLSVDLAEKVLRKKMEDRAQQESFVNENLTWIFVHSLHLRTRITHWARRHPCQQGCRRAQAIAQPSTRSMRAPKLRNFSSICS